MPFPDHELQAVLTLLSAASGVAGSCPPWDLVEMCPRHLGFFLSLEVMHSSLELQFLGLRLTLSQNGSTYRVAEEITEARAQSPAHNGCFTNIQSFFVLRDYVMVLQRLPFHPGWEDFRAWLLITESLGH